MARHGENIRKRKDGRWEGRYPAYSEEKGRKLYRSVYGRSYREAKEKLMLQKSRISDGLWENSAKLTGAQIASYENTGVNAGNGMWENTDTGVKNTAGKNMGENAATVCGNTAVAYGNAAAVCGNAAAMYGNTAAHGNVATAYGNIVTVCQNVDTKPIEIKNGTGGEENRNRTELENRNKAELLEFSSVAEEWLNAVKAFKKPSTYVKYRMVFQNHLEPLLQDTKLSMVTDPFVREKISDPLSESMGKSIYCVLNQILKFAGEQYAVIMPPVKRPVSNHRKKPVEVFSRKEQSRLLAALYHKTDRFKAAVLLSLHTGLRLGELCALKWEDIDRENRSVTVGRTVQRLYTEDDTENYTEGYAEGVKNRQRKTTLLETTPKSLHSQREIPLPLEFFGLLTEGFKEKKGNEYIFGGSKPVEPRTMQNRFKKILKEAGVENKKFHTLRHTFSTNCIEGGTDAKSLSEMLGHADVQITLNRYVHPSMDIKRRHLDTLSSFYSRICGQLDVQICG